VKEKLEQDLAELNEKIEHCWLYVGHQTTFVTKNSSIFLNDLIGSNPNSERIQRKRFSKTGKSAKIRKSKENKSRVSP